MGHVPTIRVEGVEIDIAGPEQLLESELPEMSSAGGEMQRLAELGSKVVVGCLQMHVDIRTVLDQSLNDLRLITDDRQAKRSLRNQDTALRQHHRCKKTFFTLFIIFYKKRVSNGFYFLKVFYFLVANFLLS